MIAPSFAFDAEANGYLSEPFAVSKLSLIHLELVSRAPVVILKQEADGEYANYGQPPKNNDKYEIRVDATHDVIVKLAVPVEVTRCYILPL